jgi:DNA-binding transcriptional MerR regulator
MPGRSYTISELAREFDITTRTIRFYEEKGLLSPQRIGQQRRYASADRARLTLILRGKRIGLSLDESRDIIDMYDPGHGNVEQLHTLLAKVAERRQALLLQLQDIQHMLLDLDDVQNRGETALQSALEQETQS